MGSDAQPLLLLVGVLVLAMAGIAIVRQRRRAARGAGRARRAGGDDEARLAPRAAPSTPGCAARAHGRRLATWLPSAGSPLGAGRVPARRASRARCADRRPARPVHAAARSRS